MDRRCLEEDRLLEIIFVDVGQGDGCLVITPEDKPVVIDAGKGRNMSAYLDWRFAGFKQPFEFEAAVISHSDNDHYGGFDRLFDRPNVAFKAVYTNGLMERASAKSSEVLGVPVTHNGIKYITDLVPDLPALKAFLSVPANFHRKQYPQMLKQALDAGKFAEFKMLSVADKYVPGFGPGQGPVLMEVVGPVIEDVGGTPGLRWFGRPAETKNGHSVALRLRYKNVTIFAGGDLNIRSESLLLAHHAGIASIPKTEVERAAFAQMARQKLRSDFAKACHHGSADVSPAFLTAVDPAGTVISSGDEEGYSHPRADALGMIGKVSSCERPAIFCTEIARSTVDRDKDPKELNKLIDELVNNSSVRPLTAAEKTTLGELRKTLGSAVAKYGAINLRTDGDKVVLAYQIEKPRLPQNEWDVYCYEKHPTTGRLELV
jgi:beta-lactamase superfamily II metal-dependent hydrolase